jgi:hypothetical protein
MPQRLAILIVLTSVLWGLPASAQVSRPVAGLVDGNVWLFSADGGSARQITANGGYSSTIWSPDGTRLAYTGNPDGTSVRLYVIDRAGDGTPIIAAQGLNTDFPISFSPDSSRLLYALAAPANNGFQQIDLYSVEPRSGAAPARIGGFEYQAACAENNSTVDPSERRYTGEVSGTTSVPQLQIMTFGLLHSTTCLDTSRLRVLDLGTNQSTDLPFSGRAFPSPDRTFAVFPRSDRLTIMSSPNSPLTEIAVNGAPDQVGFGANGDIYFSTRQFVEQTPLSPDIAAQLGQVLFFMPRSYAVGVYRFNIRTGALQKLYEAAAYGVGRLGGTADGVLAIFSVVPNPPVWIRAIEGGALQVGSEEFFDAAQTDIYAVSLIDSSITQIGTSWEQIAINTSLGDSATFAPPTPTPPPTATPPPSATPPPTPTATPRASGLAVGMVATVNDQLTGLNLRESPGTAARVIEVLLPGDQVTIIEGTFPREGFDWWRIETPSGARGWIAEVVGGVQTLLP